MGAAIKFPMADRCLMCGHPTGITPVEPSRVPKARILDVVARAFKISPDVIKGRRRSMHCAAARQVAYYLMREYGIDGTYPQVGEFLGRDHSSVIHGANVVRRRMEASTAYRETIGRIRDDIWVAE